MGVLGRRTSKLENFPIINPILNYKIVKSLEIFKGFRRTFRKFTQKQVNNHNLLLWYGSGAWA